MKCFVKGSAFWRLCVLFWRVLEEHLITSNVLEQRSEYLVLYVLYTCTQFSSKASDKSYLNLSGEVTQQVLNRQLIYRFIQCEKFQEEPLTTSAFLKMLPSLYRLAEIISCIVVCLNNSVCSIDFKYLEAVRRNF